MAPGVKLSIASRYEERGGRGFKHKIRRPARNGAEHFAKFIVYILFFIKY